MRQGSKEKIMHGLSAVQAARNVLTDEQAAEVPDLYKAWEPGRDYATGERLTHGDTLYKVLQAHTSQAGWEPDAAPSLFAKLLPGQGGTEVGEWVQPDSTNPYMKGDRVTHNGKTWESIVENTEDGKGRNVWEPGVYGWVEVG